MVDLKVFSEHRTNELRRLFGSSEGTDMLVVCGRVKWQVHSIILQLGSKVLGTMCSSSFKEGLDRRLELKEHEPHMIHRMLQHLYMVDYSATKMELNDADEESFVSELHTHVMMYALGDEYDIKDLKEEASWKFNNEMEAKKGQSNELTTVLEVIPVIYATTPDSDRRLRDAVVPFGAINLKRFNDLPDFKRAVAQTPNYLIEVLPIYFEELKERRTGTCDHCDTTAPWAISCHDCGRQPDYQPYL